MKKITVIAMGILFAVLATGCAKQNDNISLLSREDGSGTRGAFVELTGVEQKDESGNKTDRTYVGASITNSTAVMMTGVAQNKNAIGYISLGSLNDTVKAIGIDGAEPTRENIENGSYKLARPFNIVTKADINGTAQDFIDFILSAQGQSVVEKNGYIAVADSGEYTGLRPEGKVVVSGSSSVTPVMEKLKEAYGEVNPNATIEIQMSDSTTGISGAADGICDIGMASRELKDSELEKGISPTTIAVDGIAVIVNKQNTVSQMSAEQLKGIYIGEITAWSEIAK